MNRENENIIDWLRLIRSTTIGPVTFWQLVHRYGTVSNALQALPQVADRLNRPITLCSKENAQQELDKAQRLGVQILGTFHPNYPPLLKHIPDCPPIIYVWGNSELLKGRCVGIVGARNSSLVSRRYTEQLAQELGQAGYSVASGLARGIDRHAHEGSLKTGTVAVVAGGVDVIYPPEHKELHQQIRQMGCIVSEMPLGLHPGSTHFPRRNRIISGVSEGTVVIEAALKSGSLITARYTLEQNRELFALPGSPLDPRCQGTNDLIKKGAHLVQSVSDILDVLQSPPQISHLEEARHALFGDFSEKNFEKGEKKNHPIPEEATNLTQTILKDLSHTPISIDFLVEQYRLPVSQILSAILDLELVGLVDRFSNGSIALHE